MAIKVIRETDVAVFPGSRGQSVRVRLVEYQGVGVRLDLRRFFVSEAGELLPTSKGVALKPEWVSELRAALDVFERRAEPR